MTYVLGIDQSTQGTKALVFDKFGEILGRADRKHRQIVNKRGWISHDLMEIYQNTLLAVKDVVVKTGIPREEIAAIGISNQRETTALWDRKGHPLGEAVVWQCSRAEVIALRYQSEADKIYEITGLPLSPFFPAPKMKWLLENIDPKVDFCLGTIDSWLLFKMTQGKAFKTDVSNASRTELFSLEKLSWDQGLCDLFEIPMSSLAEICDSDAFFGETDLEGYLPNKIPIHSMLGDSHAALFGEECLGRGMTKATYGTGSSIMMNTGTTRIRSRHGLASSMAWSRAGKACYVLEGNINYTGAVITWLIDNVKLIGSIGELTDLVAKANSEDTTVLVPAFSGLSAPYWKSEAKAVLYGMSRTTGKAEILRAALESIGFQVADVLKAMEEDIGEQVKSLRVDGGPTRNRYLMQFESDINGMEIDVATKEELSAIGAAYMAGIGAGIYDENVFKKIGYSKYLPRMSKADQEKSWAKWHEALSTCYGVSI